MNCVRCGLSLPHNAANCPNCGMLTSSVSSGYGLPQALQSESITQMGCRIALLESIKFVINWIIVPGIMIFIFYFGTAIASKSPEQVSAWSGFGLGLVIFVIYVVYNMPSKPVNLPTLGIKKLDWIFGVALGAGCLFGFSLLVLALYLESNQGVAVIILLLTATSTCAFFSYLFIEQLSNIGMACALGMLCGVMIHMMFFPTVIQAILR